jgi:hypothetical protein
MITIHHIERLFSEQQHRRLYRELIAARPEADFALEATLGRAVPTAALGLIRLDELALAHIGIYRRLLNVVLTAQQPDGGWGDLLTTAVCIRALLCGGGEGNAVRRGLDYLAAMQKAEGAWPIEPIRRMPADGFTTAFVLMQLGEREPFRAAVRFGDAVDWFAAHHAELDAHSRRMWDRAAIKCRTGIGRLFMSAA